MKHKVAAGGNLASRPAGCGRRRRWRAPAAVRRSTNPQPGSIPPDGRANHSGSVPFSTAAMYTQKLIYIILHPIGCIELFARGVAFGGRP